MSRGHAALLPVAVLLAGAALAGTPPPAAVFEWFEYSGHDDVFDEPLADAGYRNPIVAGFFPDPSITRRGDDWYMVHSSFAYTPGLPVLHSRNLVDWRLVGHALTREQQVRLTGLGVSRGIFAPTIRYHDGLFWLVTTAVDAGGNFLLTAADPAGPWSEAAWLPEIDGIDPDLFFDDDGRAWIAHNGPPEGAPRYDGHRAIWLWEFDAEARRVVPGSGRVIVDAGTNPAARPIWIEAPHLYKENGWYYLLCAEGGTGYDHSAVVFRARRLDEPFVPYAGNPILTQRNLDPARPAPVTSAGHADLVRTPEGEWWAVFLATRPYERIYYNTGRETFLLPVRWQDGWPVILDAGLPVPWQAPRPYPDRRETVTAPLTGNFTWRDEFAAGTLDLHWSMLRGFDRDWFTLAGGTLVMRPKAEPMSTLEQPAYLGRRQQHLAWRATTALRLPAGTGMSAGLVAFQNETHHYYLGVRRRQAGGYTLFLEQASGSLPQTIRSIALEGQPGERIVLGMSGDAGRIGFDWQLGDREPESLAEGLDAKLLSTEVAGGFVGTTVGPHARLEPWQAAGGRPGGRYRRSR